MSLRPVWRSGPPLQVPFAVRVYDLWPFFGSYTQLTIAWIQRRVVVVNSRGVESDLVNPKVNIRILLAVLWICHFILWIFGDMFALLQEMGEPATDSATLLIAPTTAIVLTLIVVFCLVGRPNYVRLANLIVAPVYLLFNIVFFVDATQGWEYYLGVFYVLFNVLIIWYASTWPRAESDLKSLANSHA